MFWVYSIGLWVALIVIVLAASVYYDENPNFKKIITSVISMALLIGVKSQVAINRANITGNEYYSKYQPRYEVEILSKNEMSVNFADDFDDPDFRTVSYSKEGNDLVINRDDVYDNYKNNVTDVKVRLSDGNKKARLIYSFGDKSTEKGDILTLKK
ncbi:hypothetical protein CPR19088_GLDEOEPO_01451 [Companilactobacillus paralimentarius]